MDYRTLGRTNLAVSALALGTVEFGRDYGIHSPGHPGQLSEDDAIRMVKVSLDAGINFIDTARSYGESEAILGRALLHRRANVVLATKVALHRLDGRLPDDDDVLRRHMLDSLEISLCSLQTDHVDVWKLHNTDSAVLARHGVIAEVFERARRQGKIRFTGGSFYGTAHAEAALDLDLCDVIQITYSVLDQRVADRVLPRAKENNVGVVARSVLLKGALTERADHLPDRLDRLRRRSRQYRQRLVESGLGLSPAQAALAFALGQPQIDSVLVGISSEEELRDDLAAVEHRLGEETLALLAELRLDDADLLNPATWGGL